MSLWGGLRGDPPFEKNRRLPRVQRETLIPRIVTNHQTFGLISCELVKFVSKIVAASCHKVATVAARVLATARRSRRRAACTLGITYAFAADTAASTALLEPSD